MCTYKRCYDMGGNTVYTLHFVFNKILHTRFKIRLFYVTDSTEKSYLVLYISAILKKNNNSLHIYVGRLFNKLIPVSYTHLDVYKRQPKTPTPSYLPNY